jgi:osmoprotectant transport system permease protein
VILLAMGWFDHISILREFDANRQRFLQEALQHIRVFGISVAAASIIGIPLGVWATRNAIAEKPVFFITNIMQTVPSLALFGILIAPLSALSFAYPWLRDLGIRGVGVAPAIIALTIYSLLPVVRNTYVGIRSVDAAAIDAGAGMGMSRWQIFRRVELPLAAPLALEGIRTASVQAVGLTAVAALIGAGGLGWFVFRGIGQAAPDLIILGAIPIIVLALLVDGIMRAIVRAGTPKGASGIV